MVQSICLCFLFQGLLLDVISYRNGSDYVADTAGNAVRHDAARQELSIAVLSRFIANAFVAGPRGVPDEIR